jgi:hypothetical protein
MCELVGVKNTYDAAITNFHTAETFHFCETCGSTLFWNLDVLPDFTICAVGNFRDPSFLSPSFSVYETRKHTWVELPQDIEHME